MADHAKRVWDRLSVPSRALLSVLHKDGDQFPSNLRANYDFSFDLEGTSETPATVRAVFNIEIAIRETEQEGLTETYRNAAGMKLVRLTRDGRTTMGMLEG